MLSELSQSAALHPVFAKRHKAVQELDPIVTAMVLEMACEAGVLAEKITVCEEKLAAADLSAVRCGLQEPRLIKLIRVSRKPACKGSLGGEGRGCVGGGKGITAMQLSRHTSERMDRRRRGHVTAEQVTGG